LTKLVPDMIDTDNLLLRKVAEVEMARKKWKYMLQLGNWLNESGIPQGLGIHQPEELQPVLVWEGQNFVSLKAKCEESDTAANATVVEYMLNNSKWHKTHAFSLIRQAVQQVNDANSIEELASTFKSVNMEDFPDDLEDATYELLFDPKATLCGKRANLKEGPLKTFDSTMRKVATLHDQRWVKKTYPNVDPDILDAMFITDTLRVTVSVADPMVACLFVRVLQDIPQFSLKCARNKYKGTIDDICATGSPSILVLFEVHCAGLPNILVEMQIYIDSFLSLKKTQHETYELKRARMMDLLAPIFPYYNLDNKKRASAEVWIDLNQLHVPSA